MFFLGITKTFCHCGRLQKPGIYLFQCFIHELNVNLYMYIKLTFNSIPLNTPLQAYSLLLSMSSAWTCNAISIGERAGYGGNRREQHICATLSIIPYYIHKLYIHNLLIRGYHEYFTLIFCIFLSFSDEQLKENLTCVNFNIHAATKCR